MRKAKGRSDTIRQLQSDGNIHGRCPRCTDSFPLKKALLFYADDVMPPEAQERVDARREDLRRQTDDLRVRRHRARVGATQKAIDVNLGKILERVAPICEGFGHVARDCRALFDPIDYIVFNGLSCRGAVDSITFIDVKTGGSGLNNRQRQVRIAVEAGRVRWQQYELKGEP